MRKLIQSAYERATQILRDNAATLNRLRQYLLENETMDAETFETYFADSGENGESRV